MFAAEMSEMRGKIEAILGLAANVDVYVSLSQCFDTWHWCHRQAEGDDRGHICGANECRVDREFGAWVNDDAGGGSADGDISRSEHRIIGLHRANAGQDGVDAATLPVDESSASLTGDPLAMAASGGDAAVEGLGPLRGDPWQSGSEPPRKGSEQ